MFLTILVILRLVLHPIEIKFVESTIYNSIWYECTYT